MQYRVTQNSKYATICLNKTKIFMNMSEFSIIDKNVLSMSEFMIIDKVLNMSHTIYSTR